MGVHNGCHVANLLSIFIPPWSYTHISILSQLKLGLRHVEIDAWYERSSSAWNVFHEFVDPLTNDTPSSVVDCLREIRDWSQSNPDHLPVYIYFDIKGAYYRGCNGLAKLFGVGNFSGDSTYEYITLDRMISHVFSSGVFRPCDLNLRPTGVGLKARFKEWPKASELRGRVFFVLNTTFGQRGSYDQLRPGAMMFRRSIGTHDADALFYETRDMRLAQKYLRDGYIVRTLLNRTNDDALLEKEIREAFRLGIQYIACDNLRVASRVFGNGRYCYYAEDDDGDGDSDGDSDGGVDAEEVDLI